MTTLERILVVEDEEDIRALVRMSLELAGMTVQDCDSGAAAFACLDDFKPQLILCDMMLPGMNGTEILARLRSQPSTADIPLAFLTAKVNPGDGTDYMAQGAAGVLRKPFDPVTLGASLLEIWEKTGR